VLCSRVVLKMSSFLGRETSIHLTKGDPTTDNVIYFTADNISPHFCVGGAPNGGYMMVIAYSAMAQSVPDLPFPIVFNTLFLNRCYIGEPADVIVTKLRKTKRQSFLQCVISQRGEVRLHVSGVFGLSGEGPTSVRRRFPGSPIERCVPFINRNPLLPIFNLMDMIVEPGVERSVVPSINKPPYDKGITAGYTTLKDKRDPDFKSLVFFSDCYFPALFCMPELNVHPGTWIPTISLTVQILAPPASGPIYCWNQCTEVINGFANISGEMWDSQKTLVGVMRQTAMVSKMTFQTNKSKL